MSKLLINEHPLQVLPSLAVAIGLNEAIVLQQVHYWLSRSQHVIDGRPWFYKSLQEWQREFPFWSEKTIRTAIKALRDRGLLLAEHKGSDPRDRTLWYSIDYDALDALPDSPGSANSSGNSYHAESVRFTTHIRQDLPDVYRTETTTETTTEIKPSMSENAPRSSDGADTASPAKPEAAIQSPRGGKWGTAEDLSTAQAIFELVRVISPTAKTPNWADWANEIRLMRMRDGKSHVKILGLFRWANKDPFWSTNILSPGKLREKWDVLAAKANKARAQKIQARPHGLVL